MDFLPKEIEAYALVHTEDESNLLAKLNRETWAKVMTPRMLSGHLQGRVLSMFSKMISPKKLDFSIFTSSVRLSTYSRL